METVPRQSYIHSIKFLVQYTLDIKKKQPRLQ